MTLSWDIFIVLAFVIMGVYGFLLGRSRVYNILIYSYVALTVSTQLGSYAFDYLSKITDISHSFNMTMFGAKVFVFAAVVFVLILNKEISSGNDGGQNNIVTAVYGLLAAGLILSSVFSFMGNSEAAQLFSTSTLAIQVSNLQIFWLLAPILMMTTLMVWGKFRR
jgi:hypothetical protein